MSAWIALAVLLPALAYWGWQVYQHGHLGFFYELWRDPFLAFTVIARDPAWDVSKEDPATLTARPGMFGPVLLDVGDLRFGAYICDGDRFAEVVDRTRDRIKAERRRGEDQRLIS